MRTKKKIVSVYGLYNDPFTARMLLLEQRYRSKSAGTWLQCHSGQYLLPNLKPRYLTALYDFNWMMRKYALYISFVGDVNYCIINQDSDIVSPNIKKGSSSIQEISITLKYNKIYSSVNPKSLLKQSSSKTGSKTTNDRNTKQSCSVVTKLIEETNILARLRMQGFEVIVRCVLAYI